MKKAYMFLVVAMFVVAAGSGSATAALFGDDDGGEREGLMSKLRNREGIVERLVDRLAERETAYEKVTGNEGILDKMAQRDGILLEADEASHAQNTHMIKVHTGQQKGLFERVTGILVPDLGDMMGSVKAIFNMMG